MSDQIIKIKAAFRQDEKPSGIDVNTYIILIIKKVLTIFNKSEHAQTCVIKSKQF